MKYTTPTLESRRLILKRGTYEDFVKVYEYDFTRLRNIAGEFEFVKYNPERLRGFETYADEEDNVLDFIIFKNDDNTPIGNVTFDRYKEDNKSIEVSINVHPDYWGEDYATEAMLCAMEYIFNNLDVDNIIYGYAKDNFKSGGLCDKLGFEFYDEYVAHYTRIDKDVETVRCIMDKDRFRIVAAEKLQQIRKS